MPSACAEVLRRVGEHRQAKTLRLDDATWSETVERKILKGDPLWPRLEMGRDRVKCMNENEIKVTLSDKTEVDNKSKSRNEQISIDQFLAVDIRVGKVLESEAVPKSRKLLKVRLDTGGEECQIVAGIAGSYEPDDLVGRTVVFVANLKPVKLAGVESNGMILAASGLDGRAVLLTVDNTEIVPSGSQVS
jgi:methionyl-tRNA synthetase